MQNINYKNKKSLSNVVGTMLLILLILASIPLIYNLIKKLKHDPFLSPETPCPNLQMNPPIKIIKSCYNKQNKENEITLSTINRQKIYSIEFLLDFETEKIKFACGNTCSTCKSFMQNSKTHYISSEKKPKSIKILLNDCEIDEKRILNC